jgi:hypothetical protein
MKQILLSVVASLAVLSIGTAYAEEKTIDVPFQVDESWDCEVQCEHYVDPETGLNVYRVYFYDRPFVNTPDVLIPIEDIDEEPIPEETDTELGEMKEIDTDDGGVMPQRI